MVDLLECGFYGRQGRPRVSVGLLLVTADHSILVGVFDGFSWIRCEGKGSFMNSPIMKSFGDERIAGGERLLVVDLSACTGMDSTFMGTLAGLAARLAAKDKGVLQIAEPGERNRRSLEDLGLDFLMEISPPAAVWRGKVEEIRGELTPHQQAGPIGQAQRTRHVLDAHKTLSGLSDKNAREFAGVVETLEEQVSDKKPSDEEPGEKE